MRVRNFSALALLGALISPFPALADEVWDLGGAEMYYEADLPKGVAVLKHPAGRMFVAGLSGNTTERDNFEGIFISDEDYDGCTFGVENPMTGETSHSWGRVRLVFLDQAFPSRFVAFGSDCFGEPITDPLIAIPVTGD